MTQVKPTNALLILFPGFNTLDVNGPAEVFKKSGMATNRFVTIAAADDVTISTEGVRIQRDLPICQSLFDNLKNYDLLIIPGGATSGPNSVVTTASNISGPFMQVVQKFSQLPATSPTQNPRVLFSICTGAIFPAVLGIFDNQFCTTHWGFYDALTPYLIKAATGSNKPGTLLPSRFVDCGEDDRLRMISSGGISCCIDASLHILRIRYGKAEAYDTAMLLDYPWRQTEGVTFGKNNLHYDAVVSTCEHE